MYALNRLLIFPLAVCRQCRPTLVGLTQLLIVAELESGRTWNKFWTQRLFFDSAVVAYTLTTTPSSAQGTRTIKTYTSNCSAHLIDAWLVNVYHTGALGNWSLKLKMTIIIALINLRSNRLAQISKDKAETIRLPELSSSSISVQASVAIHRFNAADFA